MYSIKQEMSRQHNCVKEYCIIAVTFSESQLDKIPGRELKVVIINIVKDTNKQLNAIRKTIDNIK